MTRRNFTPATKRAARERAKGMCQRCGISAQSGECNHALADWLGGNNSLENAEHLCVECHKEQSAKDVKAYWKVRRLRGETKGRPKRDWPSRPFQGWRSMSGEARWNTR